MRRLNAVFSLLAIIFFLIHGFLDSFTMLWFYVPAGKVFGYIGLVILIVHIVISVILTKYTVRSGISSGRSYFAVNHGFWLRRLSGAAMIVLALVHMHMFTETIDGEIVVSEFYLWKELVQLALVFVMFMHISMNIRPLYMHLGLKHCRAKAGVTYVVLAGLFAFMVFCSVYYYVWWQLQ